MQRKITDNVEILRKALKAAETAGDEQAKQDFAAMDPENLSPADLAILDNYVVLKRGPAHGSVETQVFADERKDRKFTGGKSESR